MSILDNLKPGEFDRMMTPVVRSQITDECNIIRAAEQRIVGHIRTLAEQGNEVIVYPIEEGRSHILVWAPDSDREDVETAVLSIQLDGEIATELLDEDRSGNIGEA